MAQLLFYINKCIIAANKTNGMILKFPNLLKPCKALLEKQSSSYLLKVTQFFVIYTRFLIENLTFLKSLSFCVSWKIFIFGCTLVLKTANSKTSSWGWLMTEACNHYDISTYFCLISFHGSILHQAIFSFHEETASFITDESAVASK